MFASPPLLGPVVFPGIPHPVPKSVAALCSSSQLQLYNDCMFVLCSVVRFECGLTLLSCTRTHHISDVI
ncbi:hypothetical protein Y032_0004g1757 [Ancylostoma ceylanicum]|uniref:Uncharacterized protein n=1 Tax=Ancylostoma ceylanicum TaxID=53326 RepID=A0A016VVG9_9BILA|nr:hypothetical protein Y032_0004g1757 [Ancylostoma ceylanicum]